MVPEDSQDRCRVTLLKLWGIFVPSPTVWWDNILVCAVCILSLCFPHPRKLSFSSAGVHIHFIIHFFITAEWPVMLTLAVVALWSADIAAVSVVTAALAAQARYPGTHKHFICILAPKCWLIKTGLIICSCIQLDFFTYEFLAIFPQHLSVDLLITSVKIDKDNVKIICIYSSASFGGPQCNAPVIPTCWNPRRAVTFVSWARVHLTLQVIEGFLLQCFMWRIVPENGHLLVTQKAPLFLLAGANIIGFLCIMNILSPLYKHPVTQVSFCPKLLKRCFGKNNKLCQDAKKTLFLICSELAKEKWIPRSSGEVQDLEGFLGALCSFHHRWVVAERNSSCHINVFCWFTSGRKTRSGVLAWAGGEIPPNIVHPCAGKTGVKVQAQH